MKQEASLRISNELTSFNFLIKVANLYQLWGEKKQKQIKSWLLVTNTILIQL